MYIFVSSLVHIYIFLSPFRFFSENSFFLFSFCGNSDTSTVLRGFFCEVFEVFLLIF